MSYVGGPYVYDVFFSYAFDKENTGSDQLGLWSRAVSLAITNRLSLTLNGSQPPERQVRVFRDNIELAPGSDLTSKLQDGVRNSATLIVILSEFYWSRPWCRDELNWWADGRSTPDEFNCFPIMAQKPEPTNWPPMLKDQRGNPFTALPFMDKFDQPLGIGLTGDRLSAEIQASINEISAVIANKLKEMRRLEDAKERMRQVADPEDKVIFLEAEPEDEVSRDDLYATLKARVRVVPEHNLGYIARAREGGPSRLSPKEFYADCNGLVLLRSREDDMIELRIIKAARDRDELSGTKPFLCAVFNELPGKPVPSADMFQVPVIEKADGWIEALLNGLK